jgi:acetyltransferase EpsM
MNIFILGAGVYAEEVADLVSDSEGFQLSGFIDEFIPAHAGLKKFDSPVYTLDEASEYSKTHLFICGVGGRKREAFIKRVAEKGFKFATLIHPSAHVSKTAVIGEGTAVRAGCVIAANAKIGSHVIINRGSLIGHHVEIGDFSLIGPGVNIAGKTVIGKTVEIGIGAILVDNITIGENSFIGAGSLVTRDVPDHVQVVGMPAQIIRKLDNVE